MHILKKDEENFVDWGSQTSLSNGHCCLYYSLNSLSNFSYLVDSVVLLENSAVLVLKTL